MPAAAQPPWLTGTPGIPFPCPPLPDPALALCARSPNPGLWTSTDPLDRQAAIGTCRLCEVRQDCLDFALALPPYSDLDTVLGGTTASQRARIRRERRAGAA